MLTNLLCFGFAGGLQIPIVGSFCFFTGNELQNHPFMSYEYNAKFHLMPVLF